MVRFSKALPPLLCLTFLMTLGAGSARSQKANTRYYAAQQPSAQSDEKAEKRRARRARRAQRPKQAPSDATTATENESKPAGDLVEIVGDSQQKNGDLFIYEGYVIATLADLRLQADRVTFNSVTGDMVADGNVIFDQGPDQRVTARRAEINWTSRKGTFWESTGFTNRTQTGEYLFFTADRVEKTGPLTYELHNAEVTACEDVVPKWRFTARRAELRIGDRLLLNGSVFRIKSLPAFVLPYAWIPATKKERKSGFLLPTTGTSNQKGRTFKTAYYQTLGDSADVTIRGDLYSKRGIGMGAEFRAQTDEKSYLRLGVFGVQDRLFGEPGEDQGGTAFVGDAVQYFPHGWLAVGSLSLVTSLEFRQIFSDDITQVIDPKRQSTFYANNNSGNFGFNFLLSNETTTLFRPASDPLSVPGGGDNVDIKIRQRPEITATVLPMRLVDKMPIYFSLDASVGALKREEDIDGNVVLSTPAAVQRFDIQSMITVPLATLAGVAVTPSFSFRETLYTSSIDPSVPLFDPETFTFDPGDPRLDANSVKFGPRVRLFDANALDPIIPENLSRHYGEFSIDVRPPMLEKTFVNADDSTRFKHLIEPYFTYRLITGIGEEFNEIIRFDERDAVANTNELEYAVINRFYAPRLASDLSRKRGRKSRGRPSQMKPVTPKAAEGERKEKPLNQTSADTAVGASGDPKGKQSETKEPPAEPRTGETRSGLESAAAVELNPAQAEQEQHGPADQGPEANDPAEAGNQDSSLQSHEFLTVKVAQKYFFDRNFGGALIEGRRNQFYPINTLSGFSYGGRVRSLSPINIAVRYRPLSLVYADLRMDLDSDEGMVRTITLGGGLRTEKLSLSTSYYLSRRIELMPDSFEPGTFPGNQITTTLQYGDELNGLYGGTRIGYDFTNRFITETDISTGRLRNSRSYLGWGWDCCGVQFNYNTFKAGLRNESAFSFTFTLAGLGSYGTDQFSQLGGGKGARKRGRKKRDLDDDLQ